jgi:hypothetical protein
LAGHRLRNFCGWRCRAWLRYCIFCHVRHQRPCVGESSAQRLTTARAKVKRRSSLR